MQFREEDFVLVGYRTPHGISFEEGHNRATAAVLAGVLPAKIKMYLGELIETVVTDRSGSNR